MPFVVRLNLICRSWLRCWGVTTRSGKIQTADSGEKTLADLLHPTLGFLVAEAEGVLVGCVLLRPLAVVSEAAECKRLFVDSEYRGQGLAVRLMEGAEVTARAAGCRWMYLDTRKDMGTALALYQRLGYEATARYNDNPEAAYFFRKALS